MCTSCWSQMAGSSKNEHLFCPILVGQVWSGCLLVNTYVETYCSLNYNRTAFVPFQLVSFFITILVVANLIILTLLDPVQTGIEKLKNIKPYTNNKNKTSMSLILLLFLLSCYVCFYFFKTNRNSIKMDHFEYAIRKIMARIFVVS